MIITYHKGGASRRLQIDDAHCDRLLDKLAAWNRPNADADARCDAMLARRDAVAFATKHARKK